ncbi:DHA2 family efflux MFS transporter permease subunit [Chitinophaga sp. Ak27]|uniref:DHA2 family efflux MFS transporter permease subunit n=1 Tax=Chitinophaga sp. Ak27 TaxID=2726116 RepID=UPI00145C9CE2|nr:DHA2 family efflux MFS transporter permease subunit [Chitinophaga sp. Ak27]NLU92749.1 DHA2 family efflux MFS transporter permease subunit [Chitinophaga sp. Ak27]
MRDINRTGILIVVIMGTTMAGIDSSIVNISLPVMSKQFNCTLDEIEWVITVYMLSFSVLMPLTNWLKNRIGFFNLYVGAVSLFTLGSLMCALSTSLDSLLVGRVVQALGGGAMAPTSMAIISYVFPARVRGAVLGWWGLGNLIGPAMGPTLGGILTEKFGWPSIFYINLPIGIITVVLAYKYLDVLRKQPKLKLPFDLTGFVALTISLVCLQYGIARAEVVGITSPEILLTLAMALLAFICFIWIDRRKQDPIMDLALFSNYSFVSCILVTISRAAALYGGLFLMPFLLQEQMGFSEGISGLLILPNSVFMAVLMPFAGRWSDKHGSREISMLGILLLAVSMYLFAELDRGSHLTAVIVTMTVRGIGMGLLLAPLNAATLSAVKPSEVTMASSISTLMQQVGGAIGIAVLAIVTQAAYNRHVLEGLTNMRAHHLALREGFYISLIILAVTLVPAWFLPRRNVVLKDTGTHIDT